MRGLLPALVMALALLVPAPRGASAAACCLSTSAFGTGRLAIWEQLAVGVQGAWSPGVGTWSPDGGWQAYGSGYAESEWRATAWALARLTERLEAGVRVPWVVGVRRAGSLSETSGSPGDVAASVRWEAVPIGAWQGLPGVALVAGVSAPTGRDALDSTTVLGSDVAGRGAWVLSLGTSLEYAYEPWFVRLDVGGLLPLAQESALGGRQRYGPGVELALGGGVELARRVVLSLVPRFSWEAPLHLDGRGVPGSGGWELQLGPAAAWKLTPHWTLQASASSGLYLDGLGQNRPGRWSTSLGVRRAFF